MTSNSRKFSPPSKVLMLSLSGIGNFLMHEPTIRAFKKQFPESKITIWVAPRGTKQLADNHPDIDQVIEAPLGKPFGTDFKHVFRLTAAKFDTAIMLHPSQLWKGAAYMFLAGAKQRIAHRYLFRSNDQSNFLLTHPIPVQPNLHDIEQNLALLSTILPSDSEPQRQRTAVSRVPQDFVSGRTKGGWRGSPSPTYSLSIPQTNQSKATSVLKSLSLLPKTPLVSLHPGSASGYEFKRWPIQNFADIAHHFIQEKSAHILIHGGPAEKDLKQELKAAINSPYVSIINEDLLTTAALLQHSTLMISNDSGLMHLASAVGTLTLGLFGPTDEQKTGPRGLSAHAIRAPETSPVYNVQSNSQPNATTHPTLLQLTSKQVISKILSVV